MRKIALFAAMAAICVAAPAMAKNDKGNGNGNGNGNGQSNPGGGSSGNSGANSAPVACNAATDLGLAALSCSGFYSGNVLDNADIAAQTTGLTAIGVTWDGNFSGLDTAGMKQDLGGATQINFEQLFGTEAYGTTVIGIHFGGGGPNGVGNGTAFYKFDAGTAGTNILALNYQGSSGIVLYSTGRPAIVTPPPAATLGVPEPESWALMLAGFGLVGGTLRRRRQSVRFA